MQRNYGCLLNMSIGRNEGKAVIWPPGYRGSKGGGHAGYTHWDMQVQSKEAAVLTPSSLRTRFFLVCMCLNLTLVQDWLPKLHGFPAPYAWLHFFGASN